MIIHRMSCLRNVAGITALLLLLGTDAGNVLAQQGEDTGPVDGAVISSGDRDVYAGIMRVYILELESRWSDYLLDPYRNALLSFALEEGFKLNETDSLTWYVEWNGSDHGFSNISENNIKVIAAVFDSVSYAGSSDPPEGNPFDVHEVDAVAGAKCGKTGYNLVPAGFTHTIVAEDASSTG